jgi:hypothetical protein
MSERPPEAVLWDFLRGARLLLAHSLDLLMLVLAGGRERNEEQWRALLEPAGLRVLSRGNPIVAACR